MQGFPLKMLKNFYVGSGSCIPELYSVSPDWFEYCFKHEKFVACKEFWLVSKQPIPSKAPTPFYENVFVPGKSPIKV
jgi:hypothetical protein